MLRDLKDRVTRLLRVPGAPGLVISTPLRGLLRRNAPGNNLFVESQKRAMRDALLPKIEAQVSLFY